MFEIRQGLFPTAILCRSRRLYLFALCVLYLDRFDEFDHAIFVTQFDSAWRADAAACILLHHHVH